MPNELTPEHAKDLYALAVNTQRSGNHVYALRLFETIAATGEPFYTPFALAGISQCYVALGHPDLEVATLTRVTQLPKQQQLLLNPPWLALCYQRAGDLKEATNIHSEILKLAPHDPNALSALAELSLLQGNPGQAVAYAAELQQRAEPHFQIIGRMILAFAHALNNRHDQAARELQWVGQFLISSGSVPVGTWDYRDLQLLLPKTGQNAKAVALLLDVLMGKIALPEFMPAWAEIMPPLLAPS